MLLINTYVVTYILQLLSQVFFINIYILHIHLITIKKPVPDNIKLSSFLSSFHLLTYLSDYDRSRGNNLSEGHY